MAGVELGSAFISVSLGTHRVGPEIKKMFSDSGADAEAAGGTVGKKFAGGFGSMLKSAMLPALAAGGGLLAFGKNIGGLAAEAEQNMGAVGSVFKGAAGEVAAFASGSATNLGISGSEYNSFASLIGSQFKNAGVPMDQLASQTNGLITKGADLASMFGGTTSDAVGALSSALKGEMDPLEAYGISLNDAAIKGKMAEMGMSGLTGAAEQQAKTQAILALVNQQSADATGNFGREATTAAGAQQIANAQWENARATLGEALLPALTAIAGSLSGVAGWVKENSGLVIGLAVGVGGLAAAVILANAASSAFAAVSAVARGAVMAWTGVQWLLNAALMANPIGIVIAVIAGLIAAVVLAYNNIGWFKDGVNNAFRVVSEAAQSMGRFIGDSIGNIIGFFTSLPGKIMSALSGAGTWLVDSGKSLIQGFLDGIGKIDIGAAIGGVLQSIRDFFPFSPAKKGPFSGRGYTTYSGAALAGDFAKGIGSQESLVASAASGIMSAASLSGMRAPGLSAVSSGAAVTGAGGSPIYVQNPFTGDYLLAQVDGRAAAQIKAADAQAPYMRVGR